MLARAPRLEDPRLALGFGLTGAACLLIPLLTGLLAGHPAGGATVGVGAWLVAGRAIVNPAGVRTPFLLGVVLSVGVGTSLGILLSGSSWAMVLVASALAGLGGLVRPIGVTPALTLLLTAANPLPLDPAPHTGLQLLGGLLAAVLLTLPWPWRRTRPVVAVLGEAADTLAELAEAVADPAVGQDEWDERRRKATAAIADVRMARARRVQWERSRAAEEVALALRRVFHEIIALRGLCGTLARRAPGAADEAGICDLVASLSATLRAYLAECPPERVSIVDFGDRVDRLRDRAAGGRREMVVLVLLRQIAHSAGRIREALDGSLEAARRLCTPGLDLTTLAVSPSLAFDDPRVRHALRVVLGTAFASIVIVLFKPAYPHWLVIAVLVTIQPTYGETRAKVWARVGGSTAGGLISVRHPPPHAGSLDARRVDRGVGRAGVRPGPDPPGLLGDVHDDVRAAAARLPEAADRGDRRVAGRADHPRRCHRHRVRAAAVAARGDGPAGRAGRPDARLARGGRPDAGADGPGEGGRRAGRRADQEGRGGRRHGHGGARLHRQGARRHGPRRGRGGRGGRPAGA